VATSAARGAKAKPGAHFAQAPKALSAFLERSGICGAVIGGVAVIARGVPRFAADVDVKRVTDSLREFDALLDLHRAAEWKALLARIAPRR
jgi:hypothetical protein